MQRTGIRERHIAAEGEFTSHLAIKAAPGRARQCRHRGPGHRPDRAGHFDPRSDLSGDRGVRCRPRSASPRALRSTCRRCARASCTRSPPPTISCAAARRSARW
ncbi:MAG: hypothetical protein MZV49_02865 [Rhodopseudomonas palustris]|nr:hypothetical protein [Rhodopseudomonas palustris]